jgi:ubiquinone/menaquinone biosynthesis C-methylase UbiE
MQQAFDTIADRYDAAFTFSAIGSAQREIVRRYLENSLPQNKELNVLELNCGTGEDTLWFSKNGHTVLATDISEKMLEITEKKARDNQLSDKIKTKRLDLSKADELNINEYFDLIFSNFGGINCLAFNDFFKLPLFLSKLLKPNGRLIMVIMPEFCLWEMFYFTLKLNLKKAFRRSSTKGVKVKLMDREIITYYYSPIIVRKIFHREFEQVGLKPIGFFIPPSYLENFFQSKNKIFNFIKRLESHISNWSLLSSYSDHFLIDLRLKK